MKLIFMILFYNFLIISKSEILKNSKETQLRNPKLLNIFSIVRFKNNACTATSSSTTGANTGTCTTSFECSQKGGSGAGSCAGGFGVCCVYVVDSCGGSVSQNCTYMRNPGYPSAYTSASVATCQFTINKCSSDICQFRLDYETFDTNHASGACSGAGDTITIDTPRLPPNEPPIICGKFTGEHMYLDVVRGSTTATTMNFATGTGTSNRMWNIKVTQIECGSQSLAPEGCLQYFTTNSGTVTSINAENTKMLANLNYKSCVRQNPGFCSISWKESVISSLANKFQLDTEMTDAKTDTQCSNSYIQVPGGPNMRTCGGTTAAVTSSLTPFELITFAGDTVASTGAGYALDYRQVACS